MHGDGIYGHNVWISAGAKPRGPMESTYWYMILPHSNSYRHLPNEILKGEAWCNMLANIWSAPKVYPPLP